MEQNIDKINWHALSENSNAIHILEQNLDKINWHYLSKNPNAIHILETNRNKIDWWYLSCNPNAIHLLEQNMDKISWYYLSQNPNIFIYDYDKMKLNSKTSEVVEELIAKVFHPDRLLRICENYNIEFDDLVNIY